MAKEKPTQEALKIILIDPRELKPYDNNAKLHPAGQIEELKHQIREFGFDVPIVVLPNKVIIKGHGRWTAALELALAKVPCIVKDLTPAQAVASRIGDNKVAESGWDYEKLKNDFTYLAEKNFDFALTGFSSDEIKAIQMEWQTDFSNVENERSHLDGIKSVIKIRCNPELREPLKDFIITKIAEHGFEEVEIE